MTAEAAPSPEDEARRLLGAQGWPVTVTLKTPIQLGKELVESLVFQRGTFGVLNGLGINVTQAPTFEQLMMIASRLCGRPLVAIERLDPDDAEEVIAIALGFFGRCQGAGKKLSPP